MFSTSESKQLRHLVDVLITYHLNIWDFLELSQPFCRIIHIIFVQSLLSCRRFFIQCVCYELITSYMFPPRYKSVTLFISHPWSMFPFNMPLRLRLFSNSYITISLYDDVLSWSMVLCPLQSLMESLNIIFNLQYSPSGLRWLILLGN